MKNPILKFFGNKTKHISILTLITFNFFSIAFAESHSRLEFFFQPEQASTVIIIKGRVTDKYGEPLKNVTVLLIERARKVFTDANGEFIIGASVKDNLEFSLTGFKSKKSKLSEKMLNVKLIKQ